MKFLWLTYHVTFLSIHKKYKNVTFLKNYFSNFHTLTSQMVLGPLVGLVMGFFAVHFEF